MLADTRDEKSLSTRLRRKRDVRLRTLITALYQERGAVRILDMGGTLEYWRRVGLEFLRENKVHVTVVNLVATEITEDLADPDLFATAVGDACALTEIADGAFDLAHSNSVLEHVETWGNMKRFAAETRRVATYYYVQTPYFWFPIDPHYYRFPLFHWLPRPTRASILRNFPVAYAGRIGGIDSSYQAVDAARLVDAKQFSFLFPDAEVSFERFAGLRKSLIAIRQPTG